MTIGRTERLLAELGVVAIVAIAFALFDVFSEREAPLGSRLAMALALSIAAWITVRVVAIMGMAIAKLLGLHDVWGYVLTIPLASAFIAWAVLWLAGGRQAAFGEAFAEVWPQTTLIAFGFFTLFFVLYWRAGAKGRPESESQSKSDAQPQESTGPDASVQGVSESALHDRLPAGFPPIVALTVEDHYIHVMAETRKEMLLMPLAEAIRLLPEDAGQQIHRSWWVARDAVKGHRRKGRDTWLRLSGDIEAPVSRVLVADLRKAGWMEEPISR